VLDARRTDGIICTCQGESVRDIERVCVSESERQRVRQRRRNAICKTLKMHLCKAIVRFHIRVTSMSICKRQVLSHIFVFYRDVWQK
jgi:hypothetical protein